MMASICSGLRWTLTQTVAQKQEIGLTNPIDMIFHIQPVMILALLPLAVKVEGLSVISTDKFFRSNDLQQILSNIYIIFIPSIIAFCMELSELLVIAYTSSLTFSVSGIFKVS